jgi:hypothetical protein
MRLAIIFASVSLFLLYTGSLAYAGYNLLQYSGLVPKPRAVGLFTGIRASFRSVHDPRDPKVSDECRAYLRRTKIAAMVAIAAMLLIGILIAVVRAFGLQDILN